MFGSSRPLTLPTPDKALAGRPDALPTASKHFVTGNPIKGPYPDGFETAIFALGCYWGAERRFWQTPGVWVTAVGNAGGLTPNPTYEEVCSGGTGHAESVMVVYDPDIISYEVLVKVFFEAHDPTQGMRQGGDIGTQYRSALFTLNDGQQEAAEAASARYQTKLTEAGYGKITTSIQPLNEPFYFAEEYHQQYLAKNPSGYCGLGGTGVSCPAGLTVS